jgi:hypothetical protein
MARSYKKEYASYHSKPKQKKNRAARNAARRKAVKAGLASKGDNKDVHHKKPLRSGGTNAKKNLAVVSRSKNRANNGGKGGRKAKR